MGVTVGTHSLGRKLLGGVSVRSGKSKLQGLKTLFVE